MLAEDRPWGPSPEAPSIPSPLCLLCCPLLFFVSKFSLEKCPRPPPRSPTLRGLDSLLPIKHKRPGNGFHSAQLQGPLGRLQSGTGRQ